MINRSGSKPKLISSTITALLILFVITISINFPSHQFASAQNSNTNTIGTFSAKGYTGQTIILPSMLITENQQRPPIGSVVGGNWSFAVNNGQVQLFNWNAQAYSLNGVVNETMSINGITNTSGINLSQPAPSSASAQSPINLSGNSTAFKGNVNIDINGNTKWTDIPVVLNLLNGKLVSLTIDPLKTNGAFTTPLFGIVTSLTPQK